MPLAKDRLTFTIVKVFAFTILRALYTILWCDEWQEQEDKVHGLKVLLKRLVVYGSSQ